ncbi:PLP-dependent aminotransferase family protein [Agrobacterium tumefaciens]|uniref:aminotransferase-like domain-containing protein n=1 Tax=Agrobacterium tumefaciens TaxID=358 RepID=UPI0015722F46|nr:PLP-dependent aminotransferase family protein [Agrobacterium tumefaciens]
MLDIRLDAAASGALPIYRQLLDQIEFLIRSGKLSCGERLPSTRDLSRQLGISRGAVVQAYEELCSRNICASRVGRGTEVLAVSDAVTSALNRALDATAGTLLAFDEPIIDDPRVRSLMPSIADTTHLPVTELRQGFNKVLRYPALLNAFGESAGDLTLRKLICEKLLPARGIIAKPEEVLVVPGSQYGAVLIAMTLQKSCNAIHFGVPGYIDIPRNFARFNYTLHAHGVDSNGILLGDTRLGPEDLLYLMPQHHFPQCLTLDNARRATILEQSEKRGAMIMEDDYDSEFYYDHQPQAALKASNAGRNVIYFGTFSKVLFNTVRLAYVVADAGLIREMAGLHWSLSRGTNGLVQRWVAELLASGVIERHVQRMRSVYRRRRDKLAGLLGTMFPDWDFQKPEGGLQFFVKIGSDIELRRVLAACQKANLAVGIPSVYTLPEVPSCPFIVIGFGAMQFSQIKSALVDLRRML